MSADRAEQPPLPTPLNGLIEKAVTLPILGATLNNFLASRRSIRYFAEHHLLFDKSLVDDEFVRRFLQSGAP
jgi:hypothetical protein